MVSAPTTQQCHAATRQDLSETGRTRLGPIALFVGEDGKDPNPASRTKLGAKEAQTIPDLEYRAVTHPHAVEGQAGISEGLNGRSAGATAAGVFGNAGQSRYPPLSSPLCRQCSRIWI